MSKKGKTLNIKKKNNKLNKQYIFFFRFESLFNCFPLLSLVVLGSESVMIIVFPKNIVTWNRVKKVIRN